MNRTRVFRLRTTILVVLCLLFAQLALAQYVCPALSQSESAAAMEMAPGQPCAGMDEANPADQPALCHQHCTSAAQSFEPVKVPTASLPAVVQVLIVPLRIDAEHRQAVAFAASGAAQPPPPTVFLSTLRLRV